MKESVSFSASEVEKLSSNFTELREKGISYIQELSGDIWTDYNLHDPGVTVLEQLCYALTDLAYRSSLPVEDLLTPGKGLTVRAEANAFFAPSAILSSQPVILTDTRKMIIDRFDEIQNMWIIPKTDQGYQEELRGLNQVEILPSINFLHALKSAPGRKETFLKQVNRFLSDNRNIGEGFEPARLLQPQFIQIDFDIYLKDQTDTEKILANLFLRLFEFIYSPIEFHSFEEMQEAGYNMEQVYAGPRVSKGFMKDDNLGERQTSIHVDELQKLLSKIDDIQKCEVKQIISGGKTYTSLTAGEDKFFHLDVDNSNKGATDSRMENIYSGLNVYVNNKKLPSLNKKLINNLFFELWAKKYRGFPIGKSQEDLFRHELTGTYRNPAAYYSIQRHFPIIYGIGEDGLSSSEPEERKAKAFQLKAYLMLFEQHLANHLAQLGNLEEFFNIDFRSSKSQTYFAQQLTSIPKFDKLSKAGKADIEKALEPEPVFFDRKNRIYNHLLARFGEDLNDTPWKVALRLNLIKDENEFNRILLKQKSEFLKNLESLSYNRMKGESYQNGDSQFSRSPSGLEQLISLKTGIPLRNQKSLIPEFIQSEPELLKYKEEEVEDVDELNHEYRPLRSDEQNRVDNGNDSEEAPNAMFGEIGLKTLFRETLNYKNYRISVPKSTSDRIQVIFQKAANTWVSLFECSSESEAVQNICRIVNFFVQQNGQSEGFFVVDHILLSDFLDGSKYGFCFLDEYGEPLIETTEEESWCDSEEDRLKCLNHLYQQIRETDSLSFPDGKWIKNQEGQILAAYSNQAVQGNALDVLLKKAKSMIQLFNSPADSNGRLLFEEVEKIRLEGSMNTKNKNYNQRRLIFQRKLSSGEIINEDFFDLNVSVVLPNWPARFQDERFMDYLTDVIYERIPAHISNDILWIDAKKFEEFEEKYRVWEQLKSKFSGDTKPAAYELYKTMIELKNKAK